MPVDLCLKVAAHSPQSQWQWYQQSCAWPSADPPPPRPSEFEDWKIVVAAVGGLLCICLVAAVAYLLQKRRNANKRRKVLILMMNALSLSCHVHVSNIVSRITRKS